MVSLAYIIMINQNAFGLEPKVSFSKFSSLVTLAECNAHYLVENCDSTQGTLKRIKSTTINLTETLTVDSNDKKPKDAKIKKEKTKSESKSKKTDTKKDKKFEKIKEKSKKKSKTYSIPSNKMKTKHDKVENSISNVR